MLGVGAIVAGWIAKATILKGAIMASPLGMVFNKVTLSILGTILVLGFTFHAGRVYEAKQIIASSEALNKQLARLAEDTAAEDASESARVARVAEEAIAKLRAENARLREAEAREGDPACPALKTCEIPPSVEATVKEILRR